jgi:hypothetical protein
VVSSGDTSKDINLLFNKLKPLVNNREQFLDNLLSDVKYGRDNKIIAKIYADLMIVDDPEIKQSKPEIEHILPQTPTKWELEKTDIKDYVNKIGNLTLLFGEYNKEVGNEKIDKKKEIFNRSNFKINKEISNKWSDEFSKDYKIAINNRGLKIAKQIEELWSL